MPQTKRQKLGQRGEATAAQFLERKGFTMVARNAHTHYGEIDLIAQRDGALSFVEVKTRSNLRFGYPETAITAQKLEHMTHSAQAWIEDHPEWHACAWQLDVIAIQLVKQPDATETLQDVEIEYFENITG